MKKMFIMSALIGVVVSGGLIADGVNGAPAEAATCVNRISTWKAYNECSPREARHWDAIKNSKTKYGNWASRGKWSNQSACWLNVVSYGASLR